MSSDPLRSIESTRAVHWVSAGPEAAEMDCNCGNCARKPTEPPAVRMVASTTAVRRMFVTSDSCTSCARGRNNGILSVSTHEDVISQGLERARGAYAAERADTIVRR